MGSDEEASSASAAVKAEAVLAAAIQGGNVGKKKEPAPPATKPQSDDGLENNDSASKNKPSNAESETFAESATRAAVSAAAGGDYFDDDDDDDDDEDEAEWAGDNDGSSDDDSLDIGPEGTKDAIVDPVMLNGTIHLNEEGRVIYSGTWCLHSETLSEEGKRKKHPKFKLKSQVSCHGLTNDGKSDGKRRVLFDVLRPTLSKLPQDDKDEDVAIPTRRTMIFDGFFFEPLPASASEDTTNGSNGHKHHHNHGKKIKERDVEIFFTSPSSEFNDATGSAYGISGRGHNEYGPFVLDGTYVPADGKVRVKCEKTYGSGGDAKATGGAAKGGGGGGGATNKRSRRHQEEEDDSFDDDFDEKADYGEVNDLCEDAGLSIEELRRKYYGGGDDGEDEDGGGGKMASKRARLEESDDDECGF